MTLLIFIFATVALGIISQIMRAHTLRDFFSGHTSEIHEKRLADANEAHRRRIAALKHEHRVELSQLQSILHVANGKLERLNYEYEWMTGMYQDQMHNIQEQDDRVAYLETKLKEFGQHTSTLRAPFSAPAAKTTFSMPPRRGQVGPSNTSPNISCPLSQVMETQGE